MEKKEIEEMIKLTRDKEYKYIKAIDRGGGGKTALLYDQSIDLYLVCKKCSPIDGNSEKYFIRFKDEIKIMLNVLHKNIVRIYDYFLYPEHYTGYITMEYIEGQNIYDYLLDKDNNEYENIFFQIINAFCYLEERRILHRDLRPENIMVTKEGIVKVIDFGYGKKIEKSDDIKASVILNWPVTDFPLEIDDKKYNNKTEIYFVGYLFNKIIIANKIEGFNYKPILEIMIMQNEDDRVSSFAEVLSLINDSDIIYNFTNKQCNIYRTFAIELTDLVSSMIDEYTPENNFLTIISSLKKIVESNLLEEYIQNNSDLAKCFLNNSFYLSRKKQIRFNIVKDFYQLLSNVSKKQQQIIIEHIQNRLKQKKVEIHEDLPF